MKNYQSYLKSLILSVLFVSLILFSFNPINLVYAAPPTISHPEDITFNEGDIGMKISWSAYSDYPNQYAIYQDGVLKEQGYWASSPITHSISHLTLGDYSFTIYVYDDFFESNNDTVLVHVRDFAAPTIYSSPEDVTVELSATSEYLAWSALDLYPESYELLRNDVVVESDNWEGQGLLQFEIDTSELGTFNYCLSLADESNNTASDCVLVEVVETTETGSNFLIIIIVSLIGFISAISIFMRKRK